MARRKIEERNIRKLSKGGTSYYVTIPIEAIRALAWKKKQKLIIETDTKKGRIIIKDWE